ncbi:UNVERIFIED_CONTAM: hypothetical protein Slati_2493900 [Sesamum latifolium]|uniref:Uncharacterized protein n=1 Tax=Sesamum latifolium TaxID=2727402 RepID=A0AAW2WEB5_9LAMI
MEDAQAAKKESRGEKQKEIKEETPAKKPHIDTRDTLFPEGECCLYSFDHSHYTSFHGCQGKRVTDTPQVMEDTPNAPSLTSSAVSTMIMVTLWTNAGIK